MGESIQDVLTSFDSDIQNLAQTYGKKIPCCQFSGEDFQILTESTPAVVRHFFHISRNIVSHAIEEPGVRKEQGKKPERPS